MHMMTRMNIDEKLARELEDLAKTTGRSVEDLAGDAVRSYLDYTRRFIESVKAGLADADAGRVVGADQVRAELARRRAARAR